MGKLKFLLNRVQLCLIAILLLFALTLDAKPAKLSQNASISLITCSPGDQLYSVFGHSALRVVDPEQGIDSVYNYGTFDFETEGFYLKFARGKLDYMLSRQYFPQFQYTYLLENRSISEAILLLTWEQNQVLYELLEENYKPENQFYRYDFFYDNCSTRISEMLKTAFGEAVDFHCEDSHGITFRNQVEKYTADLPWSLFGISLALGRPYDNEIKGEEIMFLPDELEKYFVKATLNGQALVASPVEILNREEFTAEKSMLTPQFGGIIFLVLTLGLVFLEYRKNKRRVFLRRLILFVIGSIGTLVLLLWVATDHQATKVNLDVLWLMPLALLLFFGVKQVISSWFKAFLVISLLGCAIAIVFSFTSILPSYYLSYEIAIFVFYLSLILPLGKISIPNMPKE